MEEQASSIACIVDWSWAKSVGPTPPPPPPPANPCILHSTELYRDEEAIKWKKKNKKTTTKVNHKNICVSLISLKHWSFYWFQWINRIDKVWWEDRSSNLRMMNMKRSAGMRERRELQSTGFFSVKYKDWTY